MNTHSFEPLLVDDAQTLELAQRVFNKSQKIGYNLHPETINAVAVLLRTVNCYYSNLIENHHTHPADIEKAMRSEFAVNSVERNLQKEARAHIEVQLEIEKKLRLDPGITVVSRDFLCWIHAEFYKRIPEEFRIIKNPQTGEQKKINPGVIRDFNVKVGSHIPPLHGEISEYLARIRDVYNTKKFSGAKSLTAIAAAHHRILWVHPFGDGNGRVVRLLTDTCLLLAGIGGHGLWTASRGLARKRNEYLSLLAQADSARLNDLDGRGALSARALIEFITFFISTCEDQINYMQNALNIDTFADRVLAYGRSREIGLLPDINGQTGRSSRFKPETTRLLHLLVFRGSIPRVEIPSVLGLQERTSRRIVRLLSEDGFITSQSIRAPVVFAIPSHAAPYIFPGLFEYVS